MKTLMAPFALASVIATSAVAKTEKKSATFVAPENSVTCGGFVGADPDRVQLLRDRPNYHQGAD